MARIFDLFATFDAYNGCTSGMTADSVAILSDWAMVGKDISAALKSAENAKK